MDASRFPAGGRKVAGSNPVAPTVSHHAGALASARAQVAAVRDDPAARLALMAQVFGHEGSLKSMRLHPTAERASSWLG